MKKLSNHFHQKLLPVLVCSFACSGILRSQPIVLFPEDEIPQLRGIMDQAMLQSPQMMLHKAEAIAAEGDLIAGKSGRLPTVRAWGEYIRSREQRNDLVGIVQTEDKGRYDFTITQPLYHWGAIRNDVRNAKIYKEISEGRYRSAYLGLIHEIRGRFLLLIIRKQQLALSQMQLDEAEKAYNQVVSRFERSAASEAEVIVAELERDEAMIKWERSAASLQTHRTALSRMTGMPALGNDEIPDEYPHLNIDEDAGKLASVAAKFLSNEMPTNQAMETALNRLEIDKNKLHNTKVRLRPTVNAIAGLSQDEYITGSVVSEIRQRETAYVGISASWNIFDGFNKKGQLLAAKQRYNAAKLEVESNKQAIFDRVEKFARELKIFALEVQLAERRLKSAENHFGYTTELHQRGEASERRLQSATEGMLDKRIDAMQARQDYWAEVSTFAGYVEIDPAMLRIPHHWQ